MKKVDSFQHFVSIMKTLRGENGCPWDRVQTHESLKNAMLEECYEVLEAIDKKDMPNLCEELGDVLMQIVFHAGIEEDKGGFCLEDVIDGISKKMVLRHPHIFADAVAHTPHQVLQNWEKIKKQEKGFETQTQVLEAVPKALPALMRAKKIQSKAADVGFGTENIEESLQKLEDEVAKLRHAIQGDKNKIMEKYGDILFSTVNISRFLGLNPEFSLTNSSEKFINRFRNIEKHVTTMGKCLEDLTTDDREQLWGCAKQYEN